MRPVSLAGIRPIEPAREPREDHAAPDFRKIALRRFALAREQVGERQVAHARGSARELRSERGLRERCGRKRKSGRRLQSRFGIFRAVRARNRENALAERRPKAEVFRFDAAAARQGKKHGPPDRNGRRVFGAWNHGRAFVAPLPHDEKRMPARHERSGREPFGRAFFLTSPHRSVKVVEELIELRRFRRHLGAKTRGGPAAHEIDSAPMREGVRAFDGVERFAGNPERSGLVKFAAESALPGGRFR